MLGELCKAREAVGPIKTCTEEKLEWIARYLGGTLGYSVTVMLFQETRRDSDFEFISCCNPVFTSRMSFL